MTTTQPSNHHSKTPFAAVTHLEIRSPELVARHGADVRESQEWDGLFTGAWYSRITTLNVAVKGLALGPKMTTAVSRLLERLPALRSVNILSIGVPDPSSIPAINQVDENCKRCGLPVAVAFVLDDQADACAALAHTPTSLTPVLEASRALQETGVEVRWLIPLLPGIVYRLEALVALARDQHVDPIVVSPEMLHATIADTESRLDADERLFAWDYLTYRLQDEERASAVRRAAYRALADALDDSKSCTAVEDDSVAVLEATRSQTAGEWMLNREDRPTFLLQEFSGPSDKYRSSSVNRFRNAAANAAEVGSVLFDGCRAMTQWTATTATALFTRQSVLAPNDRLSRVLIIGAYGGDHIGDAALLGGVLQRIHERYGTTQAILMSQRPVHTRHLVAMLDVPVDVQVELYEHSRIRKCLNQVEGVVYGGGPLTDIPKQLVRHLYTVSRARRNGKPFIIEGIGAGPFVRWPCAYVGRRLVKMAQRVAVRTSDDGRQPVVRGLAPVVGRDPAFDYLESRPAELTRTTNAERQWIDGLLQETAGRMIVGINLRPIRHLYTETESGQNPVEYTRFIESRFEERFAEGMRQFDKSSSTKPCFVFFPMNAIQFGMSDLRSAYRIQRRLGKEVDFRVWEADVSIDGVVELLRRLDVVIAMRFHATIFALAQNRPVVGIDYRVGKRDKVASLLDDFDQGGNCTRIDLMSGDWLYERLLAHCDLTPIG